MSVKTLVLKILKAYHKSISPIFVSLLGGSCRFSPTCSEYSYQAVEKYGLIRGIILSLGRIIRCNPFSKPGYDPINK